MKKRKKMVARLRRDGSPNGYIKRVSNTELEEYDNLIMIVYERSEYIPDQVIFCTQADARLIAKRINQFLD